MKEFLLVFRRDLAQAAEQPSPEQFQSLMKQWQDWSASLVAQNKFGSAGKRLGSDGKVVKNNKTITNGPYAEVKESIQGYMFLLAENLEEASELAKGCPILSMGGNVEVRPVMSADGKS